MKSYNQWIIHHDKTPLDHRTLQLFPKGSNWQQDPAAWTSYDTARALATMAGPGYGVGFIFTAADPFFFLDIDDCLTEDFNKVNGSIGANKTATDMVGRFPGAAMEVSTSGKGLHIFGSYRGSEPAHGCRGAGGLELYTSGRYAAITEDRWTGDARTDCTEALGRLIADHFFTGNPSPGGDVAGWTTEPRADYTGPADDDDLIAKMMACVSSSGVFSGKAAFSQLWKNESLSNIWPTTDGRDYDYSSADAALAQHLAFWTGNNCERMLRLMHRSGLVRDKWERSDYLTRTILRAVAGQSQVYSAVPVDKAAELDRTGLKGSEKQIQWAAGIRAAMLQTWPDLADALGAISDAQYWITNRGKTGPEMVQSITPVERPVQRPIDGPEYTCGYQLLGPEQQLEFFKGCVYVQSEHKIFVPSGAMLRSEQFNASYGGYRFDVGSGDHAKPTKKAWDAFTESELIRWPIAESICFRPQEAPGKILEDGKLNIYVPVETRRMAGDAGPFLAHLAKVLPDPGDQDILLNYMAGCVQMKGVKFQWAPLIQGVQGNGKSLFSRCLVEAIGQKYCHMPRPHTINENFNAWQFNKLFIGIEDIYIPEKKRELAEILKPMITGEWQAIRKMQTDEGMAESCANFLFNSNHKDAVRKTESDRRYCVFYSAQQSRDDLIRDGMTGDYFPRLYEWLRADGYAIVNEYLATKKISHEFKNTLVFRAPVTSTTHEAIVASLGMVEQKILDLIEEGVPGFAGGWISSAALENMLRNLGVSRALSINKRREILQGLGYDWHPALKRGRVNNLVLPDNSKPVLFVKRGHLALQLVSAAAVAARYTTDQGPGVIGFEAAVRMSG